MHNNVSKIGILDTNLNNVSLIDIMASKYSRETICYINDFQNDNYDEWNEKNILARVKENVEALMKQNVKLIVVASNEIMDCCKEYFLELPIPVIDVVTTIINEVNAKYEHKNIAFLAKTNIIKANLYQRNFNYNHLYNLETDGLEKIVLDGLIKTATSFNSVNSLFSSVLRKNIEVVVPTTCNSSLLSTEFKEFLPNAYVLDCINLLSNKIGDSLIANDNVMTKGKGKIYIFLNDKKEQLKIKHLIKSKYCIRLKDKKEEKGDRK